MTLALFGLVIVAWIVPGVIANFCFDALLRHQYEHFPEAWERSGKPRGHSWRPPHQRWAWSGSEALGRIHSDWLFDTPEWAAEDAEAMRLLRRWRIAEAVRVVFFVAAAIAFCVAQFT